MRGSQQSGMSRREHLGTASNQPAPGAFGAGVVGLLNNPMTDPDSGTASKRCTRGTCPTRSCRTPATTNPPASVRLRVSKAPGRLRPGRTGRRTGTGRPADLQAAPSVAPPATLTGPLGSQGRARATERQPIRTAPNTGVQVATDDAERHRSIGPSSAGPRVLGVRRRQ